MIISKENSYFLPQLYSVPLQETRLIRVYYNLDEIIIRLRFTSNTNNSEKTKQNKNNETKTKKQQLKIKTKTSITSKKKNIVSILKSSIVEKLIVQSGWEPKNGRRKINHNVSKVCYFYLHWCDQGKIPWQTSLSQWVNNFSLDLSIVESL